MPLTPGKSATTIHDNIREILDSFKQKGSIGTSGKLSMPDAQKRAVAIAYHKAGK